MTIFQTIAPGVLVQYQERPAVVLRLLSSDAIRIRVLEGGEEQDVPIAVVRPNYDDGPLPDRADISELSDEAWDLALSRYELIKELVFRADRTVDDVRAVAGRGEVSVVTIYRWLSRFESSGVVSSLVRKRRGDMGKSRLTAKQNEVLNAVIQKELLTKRRQRISKAMRVLEKKCQTGGIDIPCVSTLRRRYYTIAPEIRDAKRLGTDAARKYKPVRGTVPGADYPYGVIQIDHTRCDIELVDSVHRLAVGRPWITVAIDVFSRMIVGYYVSFDPPGTLGTGICISNAILPKHSYLNRLGLEFEYPCQGLPTVIHLDNAREFHGNTLKRACEEYGIDLRFRKVKYPQYGGHIERMLGTLLAEMHEAPGTTFSNPGEKGDFDSANDAALTLEQFELWLANLIVGAYHHRKHSGIELPPIVKYRQGIMGTDGQPGTGVLQVAAGEEQLQIDFLPLDYRTIQAAGIVWDKIFYYSDALRRWIGAKEPGTLKTGRKFLVRRDPRDISYIHFYDPDLQRYFKIPYRNLAHPSISLWELRTINKFLADQGKDAEDEDSIFRAFGEMLRIEKDAKRETRKVRIANERRRQHQKTRTATSAGGKPSPVNAEMPHEPDEVITPFDEMDDL